MKSQGRNIKNNDILRLTVRGTTDELNGMLFYFKRVNKEYPTDKGYFKQVLVLSDAGKAKLKNKKRV